MVKPVVGKKYVITRNITRHGFYKGQVIIILEYDYFIRARCCKNPCKAYYISSKELRPYNINNKV